LAIRKYEQIKLSANKIVILLPESNEW